MAIAIPLDRVQQVLAMRIGTALAHSGVGTHAAERLRHYRVGDDLSALCEALRDGLFRDLYAILGPQMRISMPDGRTRRFRMEEFPLLADEHRLYFLKRQGAAILFRRIEGSCCLYFRNLFRRHVTDDSIFTYFHTLIPQTVSVVPMFMPAPKALTELI